MAIVLDILFVIAGFVLLIKGADFFVDGASSLAKKAGIPEIVVGLTIVAFGTSAPEAAVSISSAFKGANGLAIGNVVGSNILNVLVILGLTGAITTLHVKKNTIRADIPFMIFSGALLLVFGLVLPKNEAGYTPFGRWVGALFVALIIGYVAYLVVRSKKSPEEDGDTQVKDLPIWKIILFIIGGAAAIVGGSQLAVNGATGIAEAMHVSDRIIGLTVVALGTSLPELVTSVTAARKGSADIAIGNIVGSNIFNVFFVLGLSVLVSPSKSPVVYSPDFLFDSIVALSAEVLLLLCILRKKELRRPAGILMLVCYVVYLAYVIAKPMLFA